MELFDTYQQELNTLQQTGSYRKLSAPAVDKLDCSSNDYLGLNRDKALREQFLELPSVKALPFSAASSRLLSGNFGSYDLLETLIASAYGAEACVVYNSGYHANTGILPALAGKRDLIVADKLVHASLIDGMKLSTATTMRFRHADYTHLERILIELRPKFDRVFIVTESIFSMDGDCANLPLLVELRNRYQCFLYVDEAHAVGAIGRQGLGSCEAAGILPQVDFLVGTFGKALASVGAYIVCKEVIRQYLINKSRQLIYTTALPPINLAWTHYIFERLPDWHNKREHLQTLGRQFGKSLGLDQPSHIVPFVVGSNHAVLELSATLDQKGFRVLPIRYPTVPQNTARLRFSLRADMQLTDLQPAIDLLHEYQTAK